MAEPDFAEIKERARGMWALGDYPKIAAILHGASRALVDACAISAGQEVLDVAAGTGNLAVIAAEEGADVTASDFSPAQVELGRQRTEAEGVDVDWVVADAEELPFEDDRFDCAASVFGVMFAPRPDAAASELFRVVKPGGTVGIAAWGDYGAQGEAFEVLAKYAPPPPEGVPSPREWGDERIAEQRLGPLASSLQMGRRMLRWEFGSWDQMWATLQSAGPAAAARKALPPEKLAEAEGEVREVYERYNQGDG